MNTREYNRCVDDYSDAVYRFILKNGSGTVLETFLLSAGRDLTSKINLVTGSYALSVEPAGYIDASQNFTLTFTSSTTDDAVEKETNDTPLQAKLDAMAQFGEEFIEPLSR